MVSRNEDPSTASRGRKSPRIAKASVGTEHDTRSLQPSISLRIPEPNMDSRAARADSPSSPSVLGPPQSAAPAREFIPSSPSFNLGNFFHGPLPSDTATVPDGTASRPRALFARLTLNSGARGDQATPTHPPQHHSTPVAMEFDANDSGRERRGRRRTRSSAPKKGGTGGLASTPPGSRPVSPGPDPAPFGSISGRGRSQSRRRKGAAEGAQSTPPSAAPSPTRSAVSDRSFCFGEQLDVQKRAVEAMGRGGSGRKKNNSSKYYVPAEVFRRQQEGYLLERVRGPLFDLIKYS